MPDTALTPPHWMVEQVRCWLTCWRSCSWTEPRDAHRGSVLLWDHSVLYHAHAQWLASQRSLENILLSSYYRQSGFGHLSLPFCAKGMGCSELAEPLSPFMPPDPLVQSTDVCCHQSQFCSRWQLLLLGSEGVIVQSSVPLSAELLLLVIRGVAYKRQEAAKGLPSAIHGCNKHVSCAKQASTEYKGILKASGK